MTLQEDIINSFPSKMENRQAFVMQFIMKKAQKGEKPPSKDELEKAIDLLIKEGSFEVKGNLLILKAKKTNVINIDEDDEEIEDNDTNTVTGDLNEYETMIMKAFQGKYENKMAIIMNATVTTVSSGQKVPEKEKLEAAIKSLIQKKVLREKGAMLIKSA
ncbi:MAG: hypothetical protein ACTSW1_16220 [Candidatus Hodarchaeales archaeon]